MVKNKENYNELDVQFMFWELNKRKNRVFQRQLDNFGLTISQMEILGALYHNCFIEKMEEVNQILLSKNTFIDPMTTSTIVRNLVKKGLVSKSKSQTDSRAVCLNMTDKGEKLYLEVMRKYTLAKSEFWAGVDISVLSNQLNILLDNIKKYDI